MDASDQPEDRQGARPDDPPIAPAAGGPGNRMNRRAFVSGSLLALARPLNCEAQKPGKSPRIAYVTPAAGPTEQLAALARGLREEGYVEGTNIVIESLFMSGREDEYPRVLAELQQTVDVIIVSDPRSALAAKKTVTRVPVVFCAIRDPIAIGLVRNLARPEENVTGVAFDVTPEINSKR